MSIYNDGIEARDVLNEYISRLPVLRDADSQGQGGRMSMISSRCDKLRSLADDVQHIKENNADWSQRDAITLADATTEMRRAADIIWCLRCEINDMADQSDEIARLKIENAELRGTCARMRKHQDHIRRIV